MYLAWKLPPYYGNSNLYAFTKALRKFAKEEYTNEEMTFILNQAKWIDEEVYFMVLDDLWKNTPEEKNELKKSREDIIQLLKSLWVNEEVLGIERKEEINYTWFDFTNKVKSIYWDKYSTIDIWWYFEKLCKELLIKDWFINVKIASSGSDWWIDITADKEILIWNNTKKLISFVWQCKYKSSWKVTKDEVNDLITPVINDTNNMYQWILFFTNQQYQPNAKQELENNQSSRVNLKSFYLDWDEILDIINNSPDIVEKFSK